MVTVEIGDSVRKFDSTKEVKTQWIHEQTRSRQKENGKVCVRVIVHRPTGDIPLSTPDCPRRTGGRRPTAQEQEVFDLWDKLGLNETGFNSGNVVAFLRQVLS